MVNARIPADTPAPPITTQDAAREFLIGNLMHAAKRRFTVMALAALKAPT